MIKLFRNIRKNLLNEGRTIRYLKYAVGEILLIIIGIILAVQLQNWNERRKQQAQFKVVIEQIYNAITHDVEKYRSQSERLEDQIKTLDTLIYLPDLIPEKELPYTLYSTTFEDFDSYQSEAIYHVSHLNYDPDNRMQNELSEQITGYINNVTPKSNTSDIAIGNDPLTILLLKENIPFPQFDTGEKSGTLNKTDLSYYSQNSLLVLKRLLKSDNLNSILKNQKFQKELTKVLTRNRQIDGQSLLQLIKSYYPQVKLLYQHVGIIGTAIDGWDTTGAKSTPMIETDFDKNIWELNLYLKKGLVKFRCRDSWTQNWGGAKFPWDKTVPDGPNITIPEAGNYHIILNLSDNTYEFVKIDKILR